MSADAFWDATPREMAALGHVHTQRMDLDTERFATVAAALYNQAYRREDKKQFTREDFGAKAPPAAPAKDAWRKRYHQTEDEMKAILGSHFGVGSKPNGA